MAEKLETIQYLAFTLADELIAIDASRVREILEMPGLIDTPELPDFIAGVISLRGCAVPIIDLLLKLGVQEAGRTINSCNITVDVTVNGEKVVLGALPESPQMADKEQPRIESKPHWLRCRFTQNDYRTLSEIFIDAAYMAATPKMTAHSHCDEINLPPRTTIAT